MAEDPFETNLLKMVAAELHFLVSLHVARDMFGKGYFSLGVGEKALVEQGVLSVVAGNFQSITPDLLKAQKASAGVGFQVPQENTKA